MKHQVGQYICRQVSQQSEAEISTLQWNVFSLYRLPHHLLLLLHDPNPYRRSRQKSNVLLNLLLSTVVLTYLVIQNKDLADMLDMRHF